jgi:hypothetical protein
MPFMSTVSRRMAFASANAWSRSDYLKHRHHPTHEKLALWITWHLKAIAQRPHEAARSCERAAYCQAFHLEHCSCRVQGYVPSSTSLVVYPGPVLKKS